MRESTRLLARAIQCLVITFALITSYLRNGGVVWLLMGMVTGGIAVHWVLRARSAGDALAPALTNPRFVKRLSVISGIAGGLWLLAMIWRVHGDYAQLAEPLNLWLALGWIILIAVAVSAPFELRNPGSRSTG